MNNISNLLGTGILFACLLLNVNQSHSQNAAELTTKQWKEDLQHLHHVVHTKYSNLFYNITPKQFDSAVSALDSKIGTLNDVQARVEFVKLVAMFKVGHTNVRQRLGEGNNLSPWVHPAPVKFYPFSDGVYIKSIDEKYREAAGGKLLKIGNTEINEVLEKMKAVISFENEQGFKSLLQFYLNLPEYLYAIGVIENTNSLPLTYLKNGKQNTINLQPGNLPLQAGHGSSQDNTKWVDAFTLKEIPLWLRQTDRLRYFEYLPANKTVYVRHSAVQNEPDETVEQFFAKAFRFIDSADVDKFILDIRMNGGGNNYLNKSVITGIVGSKKINRKGHFFVITGKSTFSAAQNLTNELEKYAEVIFAGEPTSENVNFYGDTKTEVLPNSGLNVNLSWLWWQNLDPRDKRKWTAPQLAAEMSFADYEKGDDPVMELVMNYKDEQSIEKKVMELVKLGKQKEAVSISQTYLDNPVNKFYRSELENKINTAGYALMNENKFDDANKLLSINTVLFPESANAWDSYAETWLRLGNHQEAIKNYKIAISKDPNGATGENSRNMLKQIEDKKGF